MTVHGESLPPGGGADSKIARFGFKHGRSIIGFLLVLIFFIGISGPEPYKWMIVALLVSFLATPLLRVEWIGVLMRPISPSYRHFALWAALIFPGLSFYQGRKDAFTITNGNLGSVVDLSRSTFSEHLQLKQPVAYLGLLGDFQILYEVTTKHVILLRQRDGSLLVISTLSTGASK